MTDQRVIDAINAHGNDLQTISCVLAGLLQQLKASQGTAAVEAAKAVAIEVAKSMPQHGPTKPDIDRITRVFDQHR
ncbi:hypothetical protein ACF8EF_15450 [Pseudomonas sp. zjy_15]|uniref:hypothetical protein n=1 Tax=Pseudomonas sp. zjy_15 TaxID=3367265 RepID=UPI00370A6155